MAKMKVGTQNEFFSDEGRLTPQSPEDVERQKKERMAEARAAAWAAAKDFEGLIAEMNKGYAKREIAYIQKFHVPQMLVGGKLIWLKKTGFDFCGGAKFKRLNVETDQWEVEQRPVFIECKSTKDGFIPTFQESTGIKLHQIEIMASVHAMGFYTRFVWQIRSHKVTFSLDPSKIFEICGREGELKKSITYEDCVNFRVPKIMPTVIRGREYFDYLGILENE